MTRLILILASLLLLSACSDEDTTEPTTLSQSDADIASNTDDTSTHTDTQSSADIQDDGVADTSPDVDPDTTADMLMDTGPSLDMTPDMSPPEDMTDTMPPEDMMADMPPPEPTPQFRETMGYLVMEMESVPIGNLMWVEETDLSGGNGSYYRYLGNNICNGPANDPLTYTFRLDTAGVWEMRLFMARIWHCVEGTRHDAMNHECLEGNGFSRGCTNLGDPTGELCGAANGMDLCLRKDLSNDVFVRIQTPDGTFMPYTAHNNNQEQVKLFGGGQNEFQWSGLNAIDPNGSGPHREARWDLPAGDYELIIYGRSQGTRVDRILMFHEDERFRDVRDNGETLFGN